MQPNILKSFGINEVQYRDAKTGQLTKRLLAQCVNAVPDAGARVSCKYCGTEFGNAGCCKQHEELRCDQRPSLVVVQSSPLHFFSPKLRPSSHSSSAADITSSLSTMAAAATAAAALSSSSSSRTTEEEGVIVLLDDDVGAAAAPILIGIAQAGDQVNFNNPLINGDERAFNHGASQRVSYSCKTKIACVLLYENLLAAMDGGKNKVMEETSAQTRIPVDTWRKWISPATRENIFDGWLTEEWKAKKDLKRVFANGTRPSEHGRYVQAEKVLVAELLMRRTRGRRVSPCWVSRRMIECVRSEYIAPYEAQVHEADEEVPLLISQARSFKASRHWRPRFYQRHNLVTRRRTNKKSKALPERVLLWQSHHLALRLYLQGGIAQSPKFGRFDRTNRYNVDQVPCPFTFDAASTIDVKGKETVVIKGCSSIDGDKRFCTLQVCCRPTTTGEIQPRIAIIFRGKGTVYNREVERYDKRVDVYFQPKAWADRPFSVSWVARTFAAHIDKRTQAEGAVPNTMLFCDNLDSQVHQGFLDELHKLNGSRFLLPAGETEMTQPIDGGIGSVLKMIIQQMQDTWLDEPGNLDAWEGDANATYKLDACMRRILITKWVADAWEKLTTHSHYRDTFLRCFQLTGALISADGTGDDLICPMKGHVYKLPAIEDLAIRGRVDQYIAQQNVMMAPDVEPEVVEDDVENNALEDVLLAEPEADDEEAAEGVVMMNMEGAAPIPVRIPKIVPVLEEEVDQQQVVVEPSASGGDGPQVVGTLEKEEENRDDGDDDGQQQQQEEESFDMAILAASNMYPPLRIVVEAQALPSRITKGMHVILWDINDGWDVVRLHSSNFRTSLWCYQKFATNEYGYTALDKESYGKMNENATAEKPKWVLLIK